MTTRTKSPLEPSLLAERVRRATNANSVEILERLQSLWGGYGELVRVELSGHATLASAIVKVVVPPHGDTSRSSRRKLRSYEVERTFYARYAARCGSGCRVARSLTLGAERELLVLEDLDAAGFPDRMRRPEPHAIQAALAWLATFHATFLGAEPEGLWRVGTYWHLATRPDELAAMKHTTLRKLAGTLDTRLNAARYRTFVHGDAKLANVCFAPGGTAVALVDFQYVGGGVGVKDVAYLLSDCVAEREQPRLIPHYLDLYFDALRGALASKLAPTEIDDVEREWRALFPLAWLDFYRFLAGWAGGAYAHDPYGENLLRDLGSLTER